MKTKKTLAMEQALLNFNRRKDEAIALEVPFWHTKDIGDGIFKEVGQEEFIDAVSKSSVGFTCYELKVTMSDLHSMAAQTYVGNRNYLVCPINMANKIIEKKDSWLVKYPNVGIMAWNGNEEFEIIKRCRINYNVAINDWITLANGLILKMSRELRNNNIMIERLLRVNKKHQEGA